MSLSNALSSANQGLSAAARATDIVATNLANAQTEGYVRRSAVVSERVVGGKSVGLNPIQIRRNEASLASNNVRRSDVSYQQESVIVASSKIIQEAIGDIDSDFSLTSRMDNFVNSLKNLAETPENGSLQDQTVFEAKELTRTIRDIASTMQEIRSDADASIKREIDFVNSAVEQLSTVNGDILSLNGSSDIAGLQDEQERIINSINEIIPINTTFKSNGTVQLSTKTGVNLLDINISKLEFTQTPFVSPEKVYAFAGEEPALPYNAALSGLTVSGLDLTPTANKIQSISGGRLGGLFQVRDETTVVVQKQLDTIAGHLITAFRDADSTTDTDLDGVAGDVDSLFTAGDDGADYSTLDGTLGIANNLSINSKIDPDQGGDRRRIRDGVETIAFTGAAGDATLLQSWIGETETFKSFDVSTDLSQSQSIMSAMREFISNSALQHQNKLNNFEYEDGRRNSLLDIRDNLEGINIDEQTQQALFLQKIYQANAVLLRTVDEMMETIINL
ncbi:MAG: flagellar hook-associated protein 1 FlgK [Alphaproteobacteria bacterium]|jgi:flagellar hook-associated protein 1 FlgK